MRNSILLISLLFISFKINSQVTIGSGYNANEGALLDLKEENIIGVNSTKGMMLPRVKLSTLDNLTMGDNILVNEDTEWQDHTGLIVYNISSVETVTNRVCPGVHIWDGTKWQPLVPYGEVLEQKTLTKVENRNFEYLESDPTHVDFDVSLWPADKQASARNGDYILGNSKTQLVFDLEGNDYNTSRFYVGYKTRTATYNVQRSYKCDDTAVPNWIDEGSITVNERIFTDGVWTTESLRTTTFPDGMVIPSSTISVTGPRYIDPGFITEFGRSAGLLYNWEAALKLGDGTNGTIIAPGNVNQGGSNQDDVFAQGVCPSGWHLPSDQEFTDLENGIILKTSIFSRIDDIVEPLLTYDATGSANAAAFKTESSINGSTQGKSKPMTQGGFDVYLTGTGSDDGLVSQPGEKGYLWTASSSLRTSSSFPLQAFRRTMYATNTRTYRGGSDRIVYMPVRCKKNED